MSELTKNQIKKIEKFMGYKYIGNNNHMYGFLSVEHLQFLLINKLRISFGKHTDNLKSSVEIPAMMSIRKIKGLIEILESE